MCRGRAYLFTSLIDSCHKFCPIDTVTALCELKDGLAIFLLTLMSSTRLFSRRLQDYQGRTVLSDPAWSHHHASLTTDIGQGVREGRRWTSRGASAGYSLSVTALSHWDEVNDADSSYSMRHISLTQPAPASIFPRHGFVRTLVPFRQKEGIEHCCWADGGSAADCCSGTVKACLLLLCRLSKGVADF